MNQPEDPSRVDEQDPRFPSGPWVGFYRQQGRVKGNVKGNVQSRQRLVLEFRDGRVAGHGSDPCGRFMVSGSYETVSGTVQWTKSYCDYRVIYAGSADHCDGILGAWTIMGIGNVPFDAGEFHIWPDELTMAETRSLRSEEPVPAF